MASFSGLRDDPWRAAWALAWGWALGFPLLALLLRVNLFADGALFTYAVGVGDSWGHHWRNIAGRAAVWGLVLLPAEWLGAWSGRVAAAEAAYVLLFYLWPLLSLVVVARSGAPGWVGRAAVLSHIGLLPFVFGFPTEMWVAHGAVWAALALMAAPGRAAWAGWGFLAVACLSHEAGVVWAVAVAAVLRLAGLSAGRHMPALGVALAGWAVLRWGMPPDAYVAAVMAHNAGTFLDPGNVAVPLALLLAVALGLAGLGRWGGLAGDGRGAAAAAGRISAACMGPVSRAHAAVRRGGGADAVWGSLGALAGPGGPAGAGGVAGGGGGAGRRACGADRAFPG